MHISEGESDIKFVCSQYDWEALMMSCTIWMHLVNAIKLLAWKQNQHLDECAEATKNIQIHLGAVSDLEKFNGWAISYFMYVMKIHGNLVSSGMKLLCESFPGNWKALNVHTELKVEITEMQPWHAAVCRMLFKRNCMHSFVLSSVHPPIVQWTSVWKTADEQCQIPEVELQMLTTFL